MKTKIASPILRSSRLTLLAGALAAASLPLLQGCVPLIAAAGIGAGALIVADRRSPGALVDDEAVEWKVSDLVGKHFGSINHVNVTSYNRNVLLTGEVRDEHTRAEIQRLAGTVANVRTVVNELAIGPASSLAARGNDSAITSNVKTRFIGSGKFSANNVKVVTEAGTVFLLGIVTRNEGNEAAEIARTSQGVRKVVKVFEYTGETEARQGTSGGPRVIENRSLEGGYDNAPPPAPPEAP